MHAIWQPVKFEFRLFINLKGVCSGTMEELRLMKYLLDPVRYDTNVLPSADLNSPVLVKVGLALNQIIDLVSCWIIQGNDENLTCKIIEIELWNIVYTFCDDSLSGLKKSNTDHFKVWTRAVSLLMVFTKYDEGRKLY